jgi:hypothetical protein
MIGYQTVLEPAYLISAASGKAEKSKHFFCGQHNLKGAICPNCKKPLLRFLSIDLADEEMADLRAEGLMNIDLLYCWTCAIAQETLIYELKSSDEINILQYKNGPSDPEFPYPNYPIYFPLAAAILRKRNREDESILKKLNEGSINETELFSTRPDICKPQNQIGGVPYLVQKNPYLSMSCPKCGKDMPFLACITDDTENGYVFAGNEYAQVLYCYCKACKVISAFQQCD